MEYSISVSILHTHQTSSLYVDLFHSVPPSTQHRRHWKKKKGMKKENKSDGEVKRKV
ncbi:hypothetical protein LINPERPRIM_LOCUS3993, partial [Linum perenne]